MLLYKMNIYSFLLFNKMNVYTILFTLHTQKIEEHWVLHHFTIYSLKRLTVYKPGPKITQSSKLHSIFKIIQS